MTDNVLDKLSGIENSDDVLDKLASVSQNDKQSSSKSSFMDAVKESLSKRVSNISKEFTPQAAQTITNPIDLAGRLLRTTGQVAGGVNDVIGQGLMAGYRNLVPQSMQDQISQNLNPEVNPITKGILSAVEPVIKTYQDVKKDYPQGVGNLEAAGNLAAILPLGWLGSKGAQGASAAADAYRMATNTPNTVDRMIDAAITNGIKKGIKPSVVGKSDSGLVRKYYDNAKTAVRDIVDSSPTPLSKSENVLEDFSNAVATTKKKIWNDASTLSREAGDAGIQVNLQPVLNDMRTVANDAILQAGNPTISKTLQPYIEAWENLVNTKGQFILPSEAEDLISQLNNTAKSFWRDPNMNTSAAAIERVAQMLRKETFSAMEGMQGAEYAALRKRYGAQLALEKEVTDRATVFGRRNEFGFFDLANIPAASEFVGSLVGGHPLGVLKSGAILTAKSMMKSANDPSNVIRKMFKDVETLTALKDRIIKKTTVTPPDISGARPTPLSLPMPERGFTLQGKPYPDEILRPVKTPSNVIDAEFTSYMRGLLDEPRKDATLLLPNGQTFEIPKAGVPMTLDVKGQGFMTRPSGVNEGMSNEQITRMLLRKLAQGQ